MAKVARQLRSVQRQLRQPPDVPSALGNRLDELDRRVDSVSLNLAEALRLLRLPGPPEAGSDERFDLLTRRVDSLRLELREALELSHEPAVSSADPPADENAIRLLNHRVNDLGRELRRVLDLVIHHTTVSARASDQPPAASAAPSDAGPSEFGAALPTANGGAEASPSPLGLQGS